jgi:hypothetical protein
MDARERAYGATERTLNSACCRPRGWRTMVRQTRVTTISVTMTVPPKGRRPSIDAPAHEPRMEDGFFAARRTVENRR